MARTFSGKNKSVIIKRDNREQIKLEFSHPCIKEVIDCTLNVGDYSAVFDDGHEFTTVFERKNLSDLFGTMSAGYERFRREIQRSKDQNIQLIIIVEANISKVLKGTNFSRRTPISIVYQVFTIWARHKIPIVFCKDAEEASDFITHYFIAHEKEYLDRKSQCAIT